MLASSTSSNPLRRLKKNAFHELSWVVMAFALSAFNALFFARHSVALQLFTLGLLALLAVVGVIVYQRLQVIREMEQQHDNLSDFLKSRIAKFRHLMRLHDYVGVVSLLLVALTGLLVRRADVLSYLHPAHPAWGWHWGVAAGSAVVLLVVLYAGYVVGKKEHQRRYGRFLDQLDAALRELQSPN